MEKRSSFPSFFIASPQTCKTIESCFACSRSWKRECRNHRFPCDDVAPWQNLTQVLCSFEFWSSNGIPWSCLGHFWLHFNYTADIYSYKRPLDSYACPVQSKGNRTNQSTFLRGKNILKWCNYTGKSKMYSYSFSFLAQKALFLHPLETLNTTHIDPRYTLFSDQSVQLSDEVPSVKFEWWV